MENEVAGIEFSELDGLVLLDHLLKNADVLVFRNFDCEKYVSFVAEGVAAERQEWHNRARDWCRDICSSQKNQHKSGNGLRSAPAPEGFCTKMCKCFG